MECVIQIASRSVFIRRPVRCSVPDTASSSSINGRGLASFSPFSSNQTRARSIAISPLSRSDSRVQTSAGIGSQRKPVADFDTKRAAPGGGSSRSVENECSAAGMVAISEPNVSTSSLIRLLVVRIIRFGGRDGKSIRNDKYLPIRLTNAQHVRYVMSRGVGRESVAVRANDSRALPRTARSSHSPASRTA